MVDWEETDGHWHAIYEHHTLKAYPTPGRSRGWTLEIDGVPDEGLTGCGLRTRSWGGVRPLLEAQVRVACAVEEPMGPSAWAGV